MPNNETIYTGFPDLDKLTGGFKKGELILIAGRPAMGKTSFALSIMENILNQDKKVLIFYLKSLYNKLLKEFYL